MVMRLVGSGPATTQRTEITMLTGEVVLGDTVRVGSGRIDYKVLRVRMQCGRLVADLAPTGRNVGRTRYRYGVDTARLNKVKGV